MGGAVTRGDDLSESSHPQDGVIGRPLAPCGQVPLGYSTELKIIADRLFTLANCYRCLRQSIS